MKKPHEQRIIFAATVGKDGNIVIKLDFFPKMPTFEEYQKMPPEKQGVVAIINKFAALNKEFIAELTKKAEENIEPTPEQQAAELRRRQLEMEGHGLGSSQMINGGDPEMPAERAALDSINYRAAEKKDVRK